MRWGRKRAFGSALTAIATVATVAVMTACASSGSRPGTQAASTTTASTPQVFVSKRYDFAVTLPHDWSETDATVDWGGKYLAGPGSPQFTDLVDPTGSRTLMAAAAKVPTGMQLAEWQAAMVRGTPPVCAQSPSAETTTLGGEPAVAWTVKCSDGFDAIQLAALRGDRGYVFYLGSATANDDAQDRRIFEGIRQSFRFTS